MKLTILVKLITTREQESIIKETLDGYIRTVNGLVTEFVTLDKLENKTSADVKGSSHARCSFCVPKVQKRTF